MPFFQRESRAKSRMPRIEDIQLAMGDVEVSDHEKMGTLPP